MGFKDWGSGSLGFRDTTPIMENHMQKAIGNYRS